MANVASTTDEGTGATKSPAGHWTDPVPAVIYSGFLDISKLVHGADDDDEGLFSKWGRAIGGYVGDKIEEKVREIKAAPWLVIPGGAAVKYIGQPVAEEVAKAYKDPKRLIPFKAMKDDACEMVSEKVKQYEGITTEEGRQKIVDEMKNPTKETIHKIERIGVDVITVVGVAVAVVGAVRYIRVTLSNGTVAAYSEPAFAKSTAPDVGDVAGAKPKPASAAAPNAKAQQLAENKAKGDAFRDAEAKRLAESGKIVEKEVTIKAPDGTKTRLDLVDIDETGKIGLTECKSSSTAPLTKAQKEAFPQIETEGGVVVGEGKPAVPGGTRIPPTKVRIARPEVEDGR
ncbi:MAG: hypothetical protein BroJett014_32980 [Planctomycetota bacterium]|nr:MAG: hypothetical protein BroJett014_32980 [Planctomycetota bacterium]